MDKWQAVEILKAHAPGELPERVEPLLKGYSHDRKFVLWCRGAPRFLLRLSAPESLPRRREECRILGILHEKGIRCPRPFGAGLAPDGKSSYSLVEYVIGDDAQEALPRLPKSAQYELGRDAGRQLQAIHQLAAAETHEAWLMRRTLKLRRRVAQAAQMGLSFPDEKRILRYIEEHLSVLDKSPVRFQHDDYHPGNMILRDGAWAAIIDFNRCDWGDPVEDFYKVPWFTVPVSIPFSRGQVDGYLEAGATSDFWVRYNLFVAMNLRASLVWERENSPPERQSQWLKHVCLMVETHDWERSGPPLWYETK